MNTLRKLGIFCLISLSLFFATVENTQPVYAVSVDRLTEKQEREIVYFSGKAEALFTAGYGALTELRAAYESRKAEDGEALYTKQMAVLTEHENLVKKTQAEYIKVFDANKTSLSPAKAQIKAIAAANTVRLAEQIKMSTDARSGNIGSPVRAVLDRVFWPKFSGQYGLDSEAIKVDRGELTIGTLEADTYADPGAVTTAGTSVASTVINPSKCKILDFSLISCVDEMVTFLIKSTLLQFAGFLLWLSANLLNVVILEGVLRFSQWAPDSLYVIWQLVRQIVSMFVVFSGLYLGFMYIINKQDTFKKYLPWVVMFGLFVNFSYPLTRAAIDVSNIISLNIYAAAVNDSVSGVLSGKNTSSAGSILMSRLGLEGLVLAANSTEATSGGQGKTDMLKTITTWPAALMVVVFVLYAAYIFFMATGILIMRTLALSFMIVASPLLLVDMVIPKLGEAAQKLRGLFFSQLAVSVVFMIMLYLTLQMTQVFSKMGGSAVGSGNLNSVEGVSQVLGVLMMLVMLHIMMKVTKEVAGELGKMATSAAGRVGGFAVGGASGLAMGGAGLLARKTLGAGAARLAGGAVGEKLSGSWVGRRALSGLNVMADATYNAKNLGFVQKGASKLGLSGLGKGGTDGYRSGFDKQQKLILERAKNIKGDKEREEYINSVTNGIGSRLQRKVLGGASDGDLIRKEAEIQEREIQDGRTSKVESFAKADSKTRAKMLDDARTDRVLQDKLKKSDAYLGIGNVDAEGNLRTDALNIKLAALKALDDADAVKELIENDPFKDVQEAQEKEVKKLEEGLELMSRTTAEEKAAYDKARVKVAQRKKEHRETIAQLRRDLFDAYSMDTTGRPKTPVQEAKTIAADQPSLIVVDEGYRKRAWGPDAAEELRKITSQTTTPQTAQQDTIIIPA